MKRIILSFLLILMLTSFISAEIIINKQPEPIYNLGDTIEVPLIIKASTDLTGSLNLDLLCNGQTINFYKNGISLAYGENLELFPAPSLVLTKEIIGSSKGMCKIKIELTGEESILTEEFKISDLIYIYIDDLVSEFKPGENIFIEGTAIRESGVDANGLIEFTMKAPNATESITQTTVINNGFFTINISLEKNLKSELYSANLKAYEKDSNQVETNLGFIDYKILISQVPTNLEIFLENQNIDPGSNLRVKAILHDQSGRKISNTTAIITIKDSKDRIMEQLEIPTDEFFEYPIKYNQKPSNWSVVGVSSQLSSEANFNIIPKEEINIVLINKTIEITNIGNVEYCNKSLLIKIGESPLNLDLCLKVDEIKKYKLTAPDGEYTIEIIAPGLGNVLSESTILTGKAVDIKESAKSLLTSGRYYIVWTFLILVLGFIIFLLFKKGYKKSFIGKIHIKKKGTKHKLNNIDNEWKKISSSSLRKKSLIITKNKAELSSSIKGKKQNASIVCLKIKNLKKIESKKGTCEETLQKIVHFAEKSKSMIYEDQENIFFIFAPLRTKTFENEKPTIILANKIKDILIHHNKLFKQKIEFGISVNYGEIIAKKEGEILKFMSSGNFIILTKKLARVSNEEVLLSEKITNKLGSKIKTNKHNKENIIFHTIKEIIDREKNKKFISNFLNNIEKDKKKHKK